MSNKKFSKTLWLTLAFSLILSLIVTACGGAAKPKIGLKLAVNPWTGSAVNVQVAKILLEQEMGYKVEALDINENAQFAAMEIGRASCRERV